MFPFLLHLPVPYRTRFTQYILVGLFFLLEPIERKGDSLLNFQSTVANFKHVVYTKLLSKYASFQCGEHAARSITELCSLQSWSTDPLRVAENP